MPGPDARTRLYESALQLMGRNGIAATSTREILAAAGVRNPSAISYHFGSKAGLVEALSQELMTGQYPVLGRQVELARKSSPVAIEDWVAVVVDIAVELASSERGCLLARLWWEFDGYLRPDSLENFVWSDEEIAKQWRDATATALPHLPRIVGIARNVAAMRTVGWMLARMAGMNLENDPFVVYQHTRFRRWLTDIMITMLSGPTMLTDEDMRMRPPRVTRPDVSGELDEASE
jgi:AcrR family transcriptional regulator